MRIEFFACFGEEMVQVLPDEPEVVLTSRAVAVASSLQLMGVMGIDGQHRWVVSCGPSNLLGTK